MEILSYCVIIIVKLVAVYIMKSHVGNEVQIHSFLSKVLDGLSDQLHAWSNLPPRKVPAIPSGVYLQEINFYPSRFGPKEGGKKRFIFGS
jgi:hypothetical protein